MIKRPRTVQVLRKLTLQGRFALLAALAVSVAVIGAAVISYFLVRNQLDEQINSQLMGGSSISQQHGPGNQAPGSQPSASATSSVSSNGTGGVNVGPGDLQNLTAAQKYTYCRQNILRAFGGDPTLAHSGTQIISSADGGTCMFGDNSDYSLGSTATETQIAVAKGTESAQLYDTYTTSGIHVRVYTYPAEQTGYSYSLVIDLTHTDSSLHSLAIGLSFAALGGVILAAAAGFLVARSALKPVRRLTKAAEYVAATDDLSVQLPVDGADELSRLGRAFNRMTKSLAGSRERQQRLIADAGHELRTPLTSLRTNVDLLLRSRRTGRALPPGREESMLESVDQQLHELSGLVIDLLELSRNVEGGMRRTMRVAMHESVGRAVERAKLRGPGLEFDVEIEPWFVQGDPTGLDRAVVNLLDNAVKFSPAGGKVVVRLHAGEYTVRDQGPGIDPADLPRVFERFYRSDSARQLPGSGLGLAIVAQVAEETGGSIKLEPAPGGGTLARLKVPGDPGKEDDRLPDRT
ncbi:HAMP domain-containing histidine kinase [Actinospica sp. MGRD01-02]|uniref:histidine kinase n=1 Tax=Actinospica acidithermotolerans TaxID=2828514 RepID=A0A941EH23_9ACTN|nr:HAMP domain-containing sensor histidine kinase [Actinospica acidithermotolerans]MBR7831362.1 HAMP domain-containing histidine kinase [Actinospica acidithermotolerans]